MKATKILIKDLEKERAELKYKIKRLSRFKSSKDWHNIRATQQSLLDYQLKFMCCYRDILTIRIDDIKKSGDTE